jgi:hypothetical protein
MTLLKFEATRTMLVLNAKGILDFAGANISKSCFADAELADIFAKIHAVFLSNESTESRMKGV